MSQTITLQVNDMHCDSCPKLIKMSLSDINGVDSVDASLENKTVKVFFNPSKTSPPLLIKAIEEIGYTASLK